MRLIVPSRYFQASEDSGSEPIKLQSGVIRSNCMDCPYFPTIEPDGSIN